MISMKLTINELNELTYILGSVLRGSNPQMINKEMLDELYNKMRDKLDKEIKKL